MIAIEPAGPGDAETVLGLMGQFYAVEGYPFDRTAARDALRPLLETGEKGRVWLFRENGVAVGYAVLTLGWSLEYLGRDAFVDEIFVLPAYRGRGVASRGLDELEATCRKLGVRALHLEVERENRTARSLYEKRGFSDNARQLLTKRFEA